MKHTHLLMALLFASQGITQAQTTIDLDSSLIIKEQIETELDEKKKELPWTQGIRDEGAGSHIYIPDNYDYHIIQELMSGSGFGPGNGGNQYIFEVDSMIKKIIATINSNKEVFPEINLGEFTKQVQSIGVFFLNTLPGDSDRVLSAANFSEEKAILINKKSWEQLGYKDRVSLLLHEYLGVMGIERENAAISSRIAPLILSQKSLQSFDPMNLNWLYSRSNTETFVLRFNFKDTKSGKITTRHGEDSFTWQVNNNTTFLKFSGTKHFNSISYENHPISGQHMQVETKVTALDLEIQKLDTGLYQIKETSKLCKNFPSFDSESEDLLVCEFTTKTIDELIGTNELPAKGIRLSTGDLAALPVPTDEQFSATHLVSIKENSRVEHLEGYGGFTIKTLVKTDKSLNYTTTDGAEFKLQVIKKQNGIDRAVLIQKRDGQEKVSIEPMALVKGGKLPEITRSEAIGDFLPIYAGAGHTGENWEPYVFDSEGFGGFQTSFDGGDFQENLWSWSLQKGRINAKRYLFTDGYSYTGRPETREQIEVCVISPANCLIQNDRDYIVLKRSGHRYTLLRLFRFYSPDFSTPGVATSKLQNESSSLWVMDKL